ncbi:MAG: glycosyltransferase family 4 protein [Deltaproteobacteria bacterium]|nr:glycosyltransferase family 4 protein [Deltaproteobacteria bacterium]
MKIHFIIPGELEQLTGGYIYDRKIITGLSERGYRVVLHNPGNDFPFPGRESLDQYHKILKAIEPGETVIIDSLALGPAEEIISLFSAQNPMVALMHLPLFMNPSFNEKEKKFFKFQETRALSKMRVIIAVSRHTKQMIQKCGINPSLIQVINPQAESLKRKENYPVAPRNLLCVANYTRNKGHSMLIEALVDLKNPDWIMRCYGDQTMERDYFAKMRQMVNSYGLENRILLNGPWPHEALPEVYRSSDLFILPSEYESYPMVLAEALVYGIPVVAAKAGGIPEVVPEGAGILFKPRSIDSLRAAINEVIGNNGLYKNLCHKAAGYYKSTYCWDHNIDRFEQILKSII